MHIRRQRRSRASMGRSPWSRRWVARPSRWARTRTGARGWVMLFVARYRGGIRRRGLIAGTGAQRSGRGLGLGRGSLGSGTHHAVGTVAHHSLAHHAVGTVRPSFPRPSCRRDRRPSFPRPSCRRDRRPSFPRPSCRRDRRPSFPRPSCRRPSCRGAGASSTSWSPWSRSSPRARRPSRSRVCSSRCHSRRGRPESLGVPRRREVEPIAIPATIDLVFMLRAPIWCCGAPRALFRIQPG